MFMLISLFEEGAKMLFTKHNKKRLSHGYTITEVAITAVIIGALASMIIPNFSTTAERSKSSEGVQILNAIQQAQHLYAFENNGAVATNLSDLDLDTPAPVNFDAPVLYTSNGQTAYIDRSNGNYRLYINPNGAITCDDTPGEAGICTRMGFSLYPF
jgi:type II secretory pathway pseudopilin PulG